MEDGWEDVTDPMEIKEAFGVEGARTLLGGSGGATPGVLSKQEGYMTGLRDQAQSGVNLQRTVKNAAGAIDRLGTTGTGPSLARRLPAWFGFDDGNTEDQQYLDALASGVVLDKQVEQKGPQTEADAARLALSQLGSDKVYGANVRLVGDASLNARLAQQKLQHYSNWQTKYGSFGKPNAAGLNADQVWQKKAELASRKWEQRNAVKSNKAAGQSLKPGMTEDGFRYVGGDPASPKSWRKVNK